jgi:hypothetical protein
LTLVAQRICGFGVNVGSAGHHRTLPNSSGTGTGPLILSSFVRLKKNAVGLEELEWILINHCPSSVMVGCLIHATHTSISESNPEFQDDNFSCIRSCSCICIETIEFEFLFLFQRGGIGPVGSKLTPPPSSWGSQGWHWQGVSEKQRGHHRDRQSRAGRGVSPALQSLARCSTSAQAPPDRVQCILLCVVRLYHSSCRDHSE